MEEKILSKFLSSIGRCARRSQSELIEGLRKIESERIKQAEAEMIDVARKIIQSELTVVKSRISREISARGVLARKRVFAKKKEVEQKIFDECEIKIKEFVNSKSYPERLKNNCEIIFKFLGDAPRVYVRKEDLIYSDIIQNVIKNAEILAEEKIKLGGIVGKKNGTVVDETFDSALSAFFSYC
ncbi:MAG: hypothetical protein LBK29_00980 [Oscillospiraceae bacterium]|nr:hypothetical protein [Oscillospiraceae bacterium]